MPQQSRRKSSSGRAASVKTRRMSTKQKVIIFILVTIILSMLTFLIVGGIQVYRVIVSPRGNVEDVQLTSHDKTPPKYAGSVAYYVLGLLGEQITDPTEMLSIMCWDKKQNTLNILQLPQDTYLGETGQWAVRRAADVWGNPKPLDWCTTCRRQVEPTEIEDGKHVAVCRTTITKMPGSASQDLCDVFNDLLGLPVDGYFLFPQQALVKLVNLLGGIDIDLESAISVNNIDYKKGIQTLDGDGALYYALNRKSGIDGDIDRLVRQRKVFVALFQRLASKSKSSLTNSYIVPLMNGSTPLRSDFNRTQMVDLIVEMNGLAPSSMTAYILPGRTARVGGKTYFAPHPDSLLSLLNESFRPYGGAITKDKIIAKELGSGNVSNTRRQVLSEIAVEQSGIVKTTTTESTSTTAKN
ncbi:MAG: LCP family protein [Oscillospiraceae bacterium]|jgi:LCP family protein required for cell wall assembly|nr:LCP family protein [Oscillospiraceae bacterium]